ncbi:Cyanovirin-N [Roridomyces roridus]|uniref:Cyanovirin-N n=1 Tax=Roridomyces roridus TaxID=1738132 RepID=A0AAD7FNR4_9AGAR|nr:Cyanovirin-N [Roridomyces roridus]
MAFALTSNNIRLEGSTLHAQCRDRAGGWHDSSLDLNEFISNNNGVLDDNGSDFFGTCSGCKMDGSKLVAILKQTDGSEKESTIDLNQFVGNEDGKLVWL